MSSENRNREPLLPQMPFRTVDRVSVRARNEAVRGDAPGRRPLLRRVATWAVSTVAVGVCAAAVATAASPGSFDPSPGGDAMITGLPADVDASAARLATVMQVEEWLEPDAQPSRLVLVGDSLAQESAPILQYVTPALAFTPSYWGGTAPCDWRAADLGADRATVVVITFTGNSLTPCMRGDDGAFLADEALVAAYRDGIASLIDTARRSGARVVLVGQPRRDPALDADVEVEGINAVYREYAADHPFVSYVDAGEAVETVDGAFAEHLPCLPDDVAAGEAGCAPDGSGTAVVRGDGVHFCPVAGANPCPVWSSGAFRFGRAIGAAANDPAAFD